MWRRLALSRVGSAGRSLCTGTGAKLTRKQYFKDHVHKLHNEDPDRWTDRVISRHFGVPLENIQAMLALQDLAQDAAKERGALDPAMLEIASDFEEYLDDEVPSPGAEDALLTRSALLTKHVRDPVPPPSPELDNMSVAQESRLLSSAVLRLGGGDVTHGAPLNAKALRLELERILGSLTVDELSALQGQLGGSGGGSGGGHQGALQGLLGALAPGLSEELKRGLSATDSSLDLSELSRELPAAATLTEPTGKEAAAAAPKRLPTVVRVPPRVSRLSNPS